MPTQTIVRHAYARPATMRVRNDVAFGFFYVLHGFFYAPPTFTSRDPMFEKYFWISPYAYCVNNPVNVIDPTGKDTLNVTYNNETNKWDISTPIVAAGNDVINVTQSDGVNCSVLFSEGEYGKRICNVTLEDNGEQTLNVFMLSGAGFAGLQLNLQALQIIQKEQTKVK